MRKSIDYKIGFENSEVLSYNSQDLSLVIYLKCWNDKVLKFEFSDCVLFLILSSWNIYDICEVDDSTLLQRSLKKVYEEVPINHEYRIIQFFDNDNDAVVEVICKNLTITLDDPE